MTGPRRGYVLIHGAHHDSRIWARVIPLLDLPALSVDLPGRSDPSHLHGLTVEDCAEEVLSQIRAAAFEQAIVVGHSLGGTVAYSLAAHAPERVIALVGVAAVFPPPGQSALSMWPPGFRWLPRMLLSLRPGGVSAPITMGARQAIRRLANDLDEDDTRWLLNLLGPETSGLTASPVASAELDPATLRRYVLCRQDTALKPSRQRRQAQMIGAEIIEIDTGHDPMISSPTTLAKVLTSTCRQDKLGGAGRE